MSQRITMSGIVKEIDAVLSQLDLIEREGPNKIDELHSHREELEAVRERVIQMCILDPGTPTFAHKYD